MSQSVARYVAGASLTTSFLAVDQYQGSATQVTVPQGVSAIKTVVVSVSTATVTTDFCPMIRLSGNGMNDGEQVLIGGAVSGTTSGAAQFTVAIPTDYGVTSGNQISLEAASSTAATADVAIALIYQ